MGPLCRSRAPRARQALSEAPQASPGGLLCIRPTGVPKSGREGPSGPPSPAQPGRCPTIPSMDTQTALYHALRLALTGNQTSLEQHARNCLRDNGTLTKEQREEIGKLLPPHNPLR